MTANTMSSTDLKSIDKLNFTVRAFDLPHESSRALFSFADTRSPSELSLVSSLDYSVVGSPLRPSSPVALNVPPRDSNPPTIRELKQTIPQLFVQSQLLTQYFHGEYFFGHNLQELHYVCGGDGLNILRCVPDGVSDSNHEQLGDLLTNLLDSAQSLIAHIQATNEELELAYYLIKQSLKLTILANGRIHKDFENSRAMLTGLIQAKQTFQTFMTRGYGNDLNIMIDDLKDLIEEYNSLAEEADNELPVSSDLTRKREDFEKILLPLADFISKDCKVFLDTLDEVVLAFTEYVQSCQHSHLDDDCVFKYEIVSFDDHIKSEVKDRERARSMDISKVQ